MKDIVGDKDADCQTIFSAAQAYNGMGSDGSGKMAHAVQKMRCVLGGMPGLDTNSVSVSGIFNNKNIDNLVLYESSKINDDEQFTYSCYAHLQMQTCYFIRDRSVHAC